MVVCAALECVAGGRYGMQAPSPRGVKLIVIRARGPFRSSVRSTARFTRADEGRRLSPSHTAILRRFVPLLLCRAWYLYYPWPTATLQSVAPCQRDIVSSARGPSGAVRGSRPGNIKRPE